MEELNSIKNLKIKFRPTHRHYKGDKYQVLGTVIDANNTSCSNYEVLYMNSTGEFCRRKKDEFFGSIDDDTLRFTPIQQKKYRFRDTLIFLSLVLLFNYLMYLGLYLYKLIILIGFIFILITVVEWLTTLQPT